MKTNYFQGPLFAVLCLWMHDVAKCHPDIHDICLTWSVSNNKLELKCKVPMLRYSVAFENPSDTEQGFCSHTFPNSTLSTCKPMFNNVSVVQDLSNNITILTIIGHIDNRLNGMWKCKHGTNKDQAIANVTVLTEDKDCIAEFGFFTLNGLLFGFIIQTIISYLKYKGLIRGRCGKWMSLHSYCCNKIIHRKKLVKIFFLRILLLALLIVLPILLGSNTAECRELLEILAFSAGGFVIQLVLLLLPDQDFKGDDEPSKEIPDEEMKDSLVQNAEDIQGSNQDTRKSQEPVSMSTSSL